MIHLFETHLKSTTSQKQIEWTQKKTQKETTLFIRLQIDQTEGRVSDMTQHR